MKKDEIYKIGYPAKVPHQPFLEYVSRHAQPPDRILDLGGGEGSHSLKLQDMGFKMVCVDINPAYIKLSQEKGVESYVMDATSLNYEDNSFDVVLLFEVLEHVENFEGIIKEAKRVAKKRVLLTVPNSGDFKELEPYLTYDHFLAADHVNFFSENDLQDILSKHFQRFKVEKGEPIIRVVGAPGFFNYLLIGLHKLGLIKPKTYYRLYAVAEV